MFQVIYESFDCDLSMGCSSGDVCEEPVTQEKRKNGLENEL